MSTPIVTADPDATIEEEVKIMAKHEIRRLPVVRGAIIFGIFTSQDLARNQQIRRQAYQRIYILILEEVLTSIATHARSLV
jgi:CBS domain-containing protein